MTYFMKDTMNGPENGAVFPIGAVAVTIQGVGKIAPEQSVNRKVNGGNMRKGWPHLDFLKLNIQYYNRISLFVQFLLYQGELDKEIWFKGGILNHVI